MAYRCHCFTSVASGVTSMTGNNAGGLTLLESERLALASAGLPWKEKRCRRSYTLSFKREAILRYRQVLNVLRAPGRAKHWDGQSLGVPVNTLRKWVVSSRSERILSAADLSAKRRHLPGQMH